MRKFYNKKKYSLINKTTIYYSLLIIFIGLFIFISFNFKKNFSILFTNYVNFFSDKYNYKLIDHEIIGTKKIKDAEINSIVNKYYNKSIFLLPLNEIYSSILEIKWVKKIDLTTNYRNYLYVYITEFEPIGFYLFNNNKYYFDITGKIIGNIENNISLNKNLVIFSGKNSNLNAYNLLDFISLFHTFSYEKIIEAVYIGSRRWDLILDNGLILKLPEKDFDKTIVSYEKLRNNLSNYDLNNIKIIDLREIDKLVIEFK